jgi:hypothetical protein
MEMISAQKGIKFIAEPLLLTKLAKGKSPIPTYWEFLLPNPSREKVLKKYFDDLTTNKHGIGNTSPFSELHNWFTNRIVFKLLRCKDLMNWFEKEFNGQIIYLLRHPIPTNISRKRYTILPLYLKNKDYCDRYLNGQIIEKSQKIIEKGTELEKKVLDWCFQNLVSLKHLDRTNWLILYYEDLVMNPEENLNNIIQKLQLSDREKIFNRYNIASGSTVLSDKKTKTMLKKNDNNKKRTFLVEKWHSAVTREEEERIFDILEVFHIDIYQYGQDTPCKKI